MNLNITSLQEQLEDLVNESIEIILDINYDINIAQIKVEFIWFDKWGESKVIYFWYDLSIVARTYSDLHDTILEDFKLQYNES